VNVPLVDELSQDKIICVVLVDTQEFQYWHQYMYCCDLFVAAYYYRQTEREVLPSPFQEQIIITYTTTILREVERILLLYVH
jgi:hypothetical protein